MRRLLLIAIVLLIAGAALQVATMLVEGTTHDWVSVVLCLFLAGIGVRTFRTMDTSEREPRRP